MYIADRSSYLSWIVSPIVATFVFWICFGACVDAPAADSPPQARVIAVWDPLACGEPHRVVVELEDDGGATLTGSAPCALGGLTLDIRHFGVWQGRIYAWLLDEPPRSVAPIQLEIDQAIVRWNVETPR
ncbi:MAG: hypothetical protein JWO36_2737 [Myxococcales bacterium]|nr:hypothetical protein [Myxococcales bacterium]